MFVRVRREWPALVSLLAVSLLFTLLWRAHPAQQPGAFDWRRNDITWPDVPPFNITGVPRPIFYDPQVLLWGVELHREGRDPHRELSAEAPYYFNYPHLWLAIAPSFVDRTWTRPLGLILAAAFAIAALIVSQPWHPLSALWFVALIFSPPTLEAVGHGNNDLIIFVLLAIAAAVWASRRPLGGWPALGCLGLAAALKLYPACALVAFIDGRRRAFLAATVVGAGLAVFFTLQFEELQSVSGRTPRPHAQSIGSLVLASRIADATHRSPELMQAMQSTGGHSFWARLLALASIAALLGLGAFWARRGINACAISHDASAPLLRVCFRIGASVHLAYFAIGHNYIHREIMFFLFGGWLLSQRSAAWLAWLALAVAWLGAVPTGVVFLATQGATWVLTCGLVYWLARDLAPDIRSTICRMRGMRR